MSADTAGCDAEKDFIRHIANKVFADALKKIPASAVTELRRRLGILEDKYDFSIYGGRPERLAEALSSLEWRDLTDYAEKMNVTWVLAEILRRAEEAYEGCPQVVERIRAELSRLTRKEAEVEEITLEKLFRDLKYRGFKVARERDKVIIDEGNVVVEVAVEDSMIVYNICKSGKTSGLDGLLVRINKIKDI